MAKIKEIQKKELSRIKSTLTKAGKTIEEGISSSKSKAFKQKILKKPKAKGPTPISAKKTLSGFAHSTGPLVREVEEREIVQDNRSQFFRSELEQERRGINKWLG